jgi:hypothetical protein
MPAVGAQLVSQKVDIGIVVVDVVMTKGHKIATLKVIKIMVNPYFG